MKILVSVKRVPDPFVKVRVSSSGHGIETSGVKFEINPFDEIAVEEAVRISESSVCEIVVVSIGEAQCEEQLRKALAMGAHRGILVETDAAFDSLGVAKVLSRVADREKPDIILMGKQAVDDDANQAGQMLAALLGLPQATFASEIMIKAGHRALSADPSPQPSPTRGEGVRGHVEVTRETDTGRETLAMPLPAVITADLRLNEPRYVALPGILKARSKRIEKLSLQELGVDAECRVRVIEMRSPEARAAGRRVGSVDELIAALRNEAAVIG